VSDAPEVDPRTDQVLRIENFEALIERAAEEGARRALAAVGLHDEDAANDVRDLRTLLAAWRSAKRTAWQTAVKVLTTAVLAALLAGLAVKLKLGGAP
jgi:hypothetical protein